jgi:hypothetical protein
MVIPAQRVLSPPTLQAKTKPEVYSGMPYAMLGET